MNTRRYGHQLEKRLISALRDVGCHIKTSSKLDLKHCIDGLLTQVDFDAAEEGIALQITTTPFLDRYKKNLTILRAKKHFGCKKVMFLILCRSSRLDRWGAAAVAEALKPRLRHYLMDFDDFVCRVDVNCAKAQSIARSKWRKKSPLARQHA